ncbi:ATP-binding cassette domain-containing protein [Pelotomaculum propionicicum]|uniref:Sulfate/thiosulfate import ATP-binding protein CysA n=1 Tax=Pelotomaculum propionicicum TaxID=258475 RepID=A0A4Y7RRE3_9FIRM|nr:ATP-binding cassette domain-containing protein [Pelotomaculum propionicicum]TEB11443.1 Sulfate/thiosulfate import ATP-binding protein CysA [Pelotomaculum propionicicum]
MLEASLHKKLWHFTLDVQLKVADQILILLGPSGSGKTTILHLLAGLFKPDEGFIKLNDRVLYSSGEKINSPPQARNVGYLFQNYALFPHMTVRQNVFYGLKGKRRKKDGSTVDPVELLNSFGVGHLIDRYPGQLSGGEKQRVALARALVVEPELLLLDEPFSALDKNTRTGLMQEVKKLHEQWQIPFILVTHAEEDAQYLGDITITLETRLTGESAPKVVSM